MSWFFGGIGNFDDTFLSALKELTPLPLIQKVSQNFFLSAGGIPNTCKFRLDDKKNEKNWLQVGIGISQKNPKKFLSADDWNWIVERDGEEKLELDGHYVLLSWNDDRVTLVTDKLGLRDFYYCRGENGNILFSTRIDWLAKLIPTEIDFAEFGSRWLLFNQVSSKSILKNIHRVVGGSILSIERQSKKTVQKEINWLPDLSGGLYTEKEFSAGLEDLITFPMRENKLSLSLSGGLDSRVILSYLLKQKGNWDTHSFGSNNHPDFRVSGRMAADLGIKHHHIEAPPVPFAEFIKTLKDYIGLTVMSTSASSLFQLGNYKLLQDSPEIIIDGCLGEIWRRQFFNRLSFSGQKHILRRDYKNIVKLITLQRVDLFNEEIRSIMQRGCEDQIAGIYDLLPAPEKIGVNNWIDLFAIKTRFPNYFLHEQTRTDSIVLSYMPFGQLSILNHLLQVDHSLRTNAKMLKRIIGTNAHVLQNYPLVKGDIQHPYMMNSFQTRILSKVLKSIRRNRVKDLEDHTLINSFSSALSEIIDSQSAIDSSLYGTGKLSSMRASATDIKSKIGSIGELDWWLAFEMFRRQIRKS